MADLADSVIRVRIDTYRKEFPTIERRRKLACAILSPEAELPDYSSSHIKSAWYQLSLLWADRAGSKTQWLGAYLWRSAELVQKQAGERVSIFQSGSPDISIKDGGYVSLLTGVLVSEPGLSYAAINHRFTRKPPYTASASTIDLDPPTIYGEAALRLKDVRRISIDRSGYSLGELAAEEQLVPIAELYSNIGSDAAYAQRTGLVVLRTLKVGTTANTAYLRRVSREVDGGMPEALDALSISAPRALPAGDPAAS